MNRLRAWIRALLGFSRTETNGFLILLPLMVIILASAPLYQWWISSRPVDSSTDARKLDSLVSHWEWNQPDSASKKTAQLFTFNPNNASKQTLLELGMNENLATRIVNYRSKGGIFKVKKDLAKIYGMDFALYLALSAYIDLPENKILNGKESAFSIKPKSAPFERFDINLADTSQLIKIYGVGSKLSLRIINYRDKLGGFITMQQLGEVYGLDSMVIRSLEKRYFIAEGFGPRKININQSDQKVIASHPYIKFSLAKAIATYRFQHGEFRQIEDLKSIVSLDESTFEKIKPYITVKE
jgi:DNA uptake protein ComE-like DNA-binding protein